jgi:hypothetical protein
MLATRQPSGSAINFELFINQGEKRKNNDDKKIQPTISDSIHLSWLCPGEPRSRP